MNYITRTMSLLVVPDGEPVFADGATTVSIADEAAGEFVEVTQSGDAGLGKVCINTEEWPALRAAIDRMIDECRG